MVLGVGAAASRMRRYLTLRRLAAVRRELFGESPSQTTRHFS